jgi:hypothetical protein
MVWAPRVASAGAVTMAEKVLLAATVTVDGTVAMLTASHVMVTVVPAPKLVPVTISTPVPSLGFSVMAAGACGIEEPFRSSFLLRPASQTVVSDAPRPPTLKVTVLP